MAFSKERLHYLASRNRLVVALIAFGACFAVGDYIGGLAQTEAKRRSVLVLRDILSQETAGAESRAIKERRFYAVLSRAVATPPLPAGTKPPPLVDVFAKPPPPPPSGSVLEQERAKDLQMSLEARMASLTLQAGIANTTLESLSETGAVIDGVFYSIGERISSVIYFDSEERILKNPTLEAIDADSVILAAKHKKRTDKVRLEVKF